MEGYYSGEDEGYAQSSCTSCVISIASDIRRGVQVYGRMYAPYGKHFYGLPLDEQERDRNEPQHAKFILMYDDPLHLAPIVSEPQRIPDLGTGSGICAIDMADRHPSAEVLGLSLDVETDWVQAKDTFDFIHGGEFIFYCCWLGFENVFIWFLFPETFGRTLEELAFIFKDKTKADAAVAAVETAKAGFDHEKGGTTVVEDVRQV